MAHRHCERRPPAQRTQHSRSFPPIPLGVRTRRPPVGIATAGAVRPPRNDGYQVRPAHLAAASRRSIPQPARVRAARRSSPARAGWPIRAVIASAGRPRGNPSLSAHPSEHHDGYGRGRKRHRLRRVECDERAPLRTSPLATPGLVGCPPLPPSRGASGAEQAGSSRGRAVRRGADGVSAQGKAPAG